MHKQEWQKRFDGLKLKLLNAFGLYFPDYTLEFPLGNVLMQVADVDATRIHQSIAFGSYKFSDPALRWDTHKKELYAIFYFVVVKWSFYLAGKSFIFETDHANLRYLENSENAMVIRWKVALQNFSFLLRHIPGRDNEVADWLSRDVAMFNCLYLLDDYFSQDYEASTNLEYDLLMANTDDTPHLNEDEDDYDDDEFMPTPHDESPALSLVRPDCLEALFKSLHNGRVGHWGPTRMFQMANRQMPGHGVPLRLFKEFVSSCINCQKERLDLNGRLIGII